VAVGAGRGGRSTGGVRRHGNKLKTGHLKGNRFTIRLRDLAPADGGDLRDRIAQLSKTGYPNYFGPQRFGPEGRNEVEGLLCLRGTGRRVEPRRLRFLLSAVQSGLFNDLLAARIQRACFSRVIAGDVLQKADTGGMFVCTDPLTDQARADQLAIHPTGPIFGPKMKQPEGEAAALEKEVLGRAGLGEEDFKRHRKLTQGTRRALRLVPENLEVAPEAGAVTLSFTLPAGAYATTLLRELFAYREE
jgi:tRNA pseudouridine13 synthase